MCIRDRRRPGVWREELGIRRVPHDVVVGSGMSTSTPSSHRPASSTIFVSVGAGLDQAAERTPPQEHRGAYTITDLAEIFNISRPTVYRTLTRAAWNPDCTSGQLLGLLRRSATTAADASHDAELLPVALQPG